MSRRHKLWAAAQRRHLYSCLGGRCQCCKSETNLTFDCIVPQGNGHHPKSAPERICFYRKEMRKGNVQLLCAECNSMKGALPMEVWCSAMSMMIASDEYKRLWVASGRDTGAMQENRRHLMREILSSLRCNETFTTVDVPY